jgi:hypothetical protein
MQRRQCAIVRQSHLITVVGTFLIGCAFLLLAVGCSGTRSEAPKEQEKGHTGATNTEQGRTAEATSEEEARCEGTRTTKVPRLDKGDFITNDLPGCPKGGLLLGTDKADKLGGKAGDDEIHSLGGKDVISGGDGNDVIYAGPGDDSFLWDGKGDDVIYGGDGDDGEFLDDRGDDVIHGGDGGDFVLEANGANVIYGGNGNDFIDVVMKDGQPDKFYCGKGKDEYAQDGSAQIAKNDYVDSSCEKKTKIRGIP